MATIVSYTKHWDNDTKGTMEFPTSNIFYAIDQVHTILVADAVEDGATPRPVELYSVAAAQLFTITKAEVGESSNWTGVPS